MGRFNRNITLGPVDLTLTPSFTLGGINYEVNEEYVWVINAADVELRSSTFLPPDPCPTSDPGADQWGMPTLLRQSNPEERRPRQAKLTAIAAESSR